MMAMARSRLVIGIVGAAFACVMLAVQAGTAQETPSPERVVIPAGATALEGIPTVRVDSAQDATTRRVLDADEAAKARLTVRVANGQFYWTTRGNRLLHLNASGEFTYLSSEPGQYIRLTRLNDKISYVEHVDLTSGSVTWFGELRIVIGK
jgi:hypothetical protein